MPRWRALPDELDPQVREFASQLRRLVDRSGLSVAALADRTGYSKTSWERYLNGRLLAPKGAIVALAEVTGTNPIHLTTMWELAERAWSRSEMRHDMTMEAIRISQARAALGAALLMLLVSSGASAALRDLASASSGASFSLTVLTYVIVLALAADVIQLPLAFYAGVTLERRYGLSTQTLASWWTDHIKAVVIGLAFACGAALLVAWLIRWNPERWWLLAAAAFSAVTIMLAQLAPVLLLPIFYRFKPLDRPALTARLVALAERARARDELVHGHGLDPRVDGVAPHVGPEAHRRDPAGHERAAVGRAGPAGHGVGVAPSVPAPRLAGEPDDRMRRIGRPARRPRHHDADGF